LDWFPRLRTSSLDTENSDSSAFEIKKLSSLLEDTKHDLKTVCSDLKSLNKHVSIERYIYSSIVIYIPLHNKFYTTS